MKPRAVEKKESSTETDEGLGSSGRRSGSAGSDSQDWTLSSSVSPDERYMTSSFPHSASQSLSKVLSAEQMTYGDMEMVTQLLAERDRDLELAARIGQSLLQRNKVLQERNEAVEEQLAEAMDRVHQLQHELAKKDELLRMVESDSSASTPVCQPQPVGVAQLETLHSKLQELEEENLTLRSEARQLQRETVSYEEKEQQLVGDCVRELRRSNTQIASFGKELSQKKEELLRHQEEMAQLLSQIVELQRRVKELALEKEELRFHLQASKDAQRQLTAELDELSERNAECVEMLHESQQEIRDLRSRNAPSARCHAPYGLYPMDSLAAEIEVSMRRELSLEDETDQRRSQKRVFQTVRSANAATPPSSLVMTPQTFPSNQSNDVLLSDDVVSAVHRLSLRRHNSVWGRSSNMADVSFGFKSFLPEKLQIVKPMEGSVTLHHWQQLAKPHLASILDPHPGVVTKGFRPLAHDAPQRLSDMEEDDEDSAPRVCRAPCLTSPLNPGKCQSSTFSTYTITTCRILHPSDITQVTPSCQSSCVAPPPSSLRLRPNAPCRLAELVTEKGISAQVSTETPRPFLASRPAELFLQDVYGPHPDLPASHLADRLRRLGFVSAGGGLRRNQSLPALSGSKR